MSSEVESIKSVVYDLEERIDSLESKVKDIIEQIEHLNEMNEMGSEFNTSTLKNFGNIFDRLTAIEISKKLNDKLSKLIYGSKNKNWIDKLDEFKPNKSFHEFRDDEIILVKERKKGDK